MSGTYWSVGDKVNISQTDIEIKCEGSDSFTENQVIGVYIPPSVAFFSGRDTTLNFDVEIAYDTTGSSVPTKWLLDSITGANGLFSKCVVYAGNRQSVIETLDHYSSWCSVKYDYDTNDSLKSKRAMVEGAGEWLPSTRGDMGTTKSIQSNSMYSPYNEQPNLAGQPTDSITTATPYTKASVSIPIHMGMFANNEKAVPNVLLGGCYLELTCERNSRVMRVLDQTAVHRKTAFGPTFHGINVGGDQWTDAATSTEFFTQKWNSQIDPQHSPFQVGEQLIVKELATGTQINFDPPLIITGIETGGSATAPIKYTCNATKPSVSMSNTDGSPYYVFGSSRHGSSDPKYTLSNVRLNVRQLNIEGYEKGMISKMKSGGSIMFDIPSVASQLNSITTGELQASVSIDCPHAKARSVLVMPTDNNAVYSTAVNSDSSSTYLIDELEFNPKATDHFIANYSDRSGVSGIGDSLTSYNFIIDNKIVPSRRVNTDKSSSTTLGMNMDHIIELEKALNQSHQTPARSFSSFKSNFLIGRALTLDENTIYDGRGKDMRLQLRYEGTAPTKNKLLKTFISHIKTISIEGTNVNVVQ